MQLKDKVCIADVQVEQGEKSTKELRSSYGQDNVMFVRCDVTDAAVLVGDFKAAISKFAQIDVMCNNAGIFDKSVWEKQIDINFNDVVRGTMLAINHMRKDKGGKGGVIINTSSLTGAFKSAVSKFGQIDVMCNNAGIADERIWEKQIAINFTAVVRGTMLAIDHMRKDKGGKGGVIINTASLAVISPNYWFPVYAGTKSAVQNFTSSWAKNPEMRAAEIRFASICPGAARTALMDMDDGQIINLPHFKQLMEQFGYCTVEQVVEAFLKVMEDDSLNGVLFSINKKEGVTCKKFILVPMDQPPVE